MTASDCEFDDPVMSEPPPPLTLVSTEPLVNEALINNWKSGEKINKQTKNSLHYSEFNSVSKKVLGSQSVMAY